MATPTPDTTAALDTLPIVLSAIALLLSLTLALRTERRARREEARASAADDRAREVEKRAIRAEKRAEAAEQRAVEAAANAAWSEAIEAAFRLMSTPTEGDFSERFQTLGIRLTALVDTLPEWDALGEWLSAEHLLGTSLRWQVKALQSSNATDDEVLGASSRYADWVQALVNNLRFFRTSGYQEPKLLDLADTAKGHAETLRQKYGWPTPGSDSRLEVLDDDDPIGS